MLRYQGFVFVEWGHRLLLRQSVQLKLIPCEAEIVAVLQGLLIVRRLVRTVHAIHTFEVFSSNINQLPENLPLGFIYEYFFRNLAPIFFASNNH